MIDCRMTRARTEAVGTYKRLTVERLCVHLHRFAADTRGATGILMAAGIMATLGALALATETARGYLVKSRLTYALDAAGLAGGRAMYSPNRDADINMYFSANFPPDYMDSTISGPHIVVVDDDVIKLSARATVPTTIMRIFGIETFDISAETEITRQTQPLDVVIAMDMSTSMSWNGGGQPRIQAARTAAKDLVDILFGSDAVKSTLKIGLVPWNSKVNVMLEGTTYDPDLTVAEPVTPFTNPITGDAQDVVYKVNNSPVPLLNPPPANWRGCVYQRYIHNGSTDDDADTLLGDHSFAGGDWVAWEVLGPSDEPPSMGGTCPTCRPCLGVGISPNRTYGITPLTSTRAVIDDAIDGLVQPNGQTNIPQGLGWAWHVLDPSPPFTEADPDPPGNRQQAIVLLTDGQNWGGPGDGYKMAFNEGENQPEMDARLLELAANIKAASVRLYVVQYFFNDGALADLLKEVASSPDPPYYFFAPDAATLQANFHEIANHLSNLRVSR